MRMRQMVCAIALILLVSMGASAQITYFVGGAGNGGVGYPGASKYNALGTDSANFALNMEGHNELVAPVTVCADLGSGNTTNSFDVGDQFRITYSSNITLPGQPVGLNLSPGIFTLGNAFTTNTTAGGILAVTSVADTVTTPGGPTTQVTLTVTQAPTTGGNCIEVHNLRFDIAGANPFGSSIAVGTALTVSVLEVTNNNNAVTNGYPVNANLKTNVPLLATNVVGTTFTTLGAASGTVASTAGATGLPTGYSNALVSVPQMVQNGSITTTGTVVVQQPAAVAQSGLGGGLLRSFTTSGGTNNPTTDYLNLSGATNPTQVRIDVYDMPIGSSVTFPASYVFPAGSTIGSNNNAATFAMALAGSGTIGPAATGSTTGFVTYNVVLNRLNGAVTSFPVPFTVTEAALGSAVGTARVSVRIAPADDGTTPCALATVKPCYKVPTSAAVPSQAGTISNATQIALYMIVPSTTSLYFTYGLVSGYTATGGVTNNTYDTGLLVSNSGQDVFGASNATRTVGQDNTFTFYFFPDKATNATNTAVSSIRSDAATFPNTNLLETVTPAGRLAQGNNYTALLSQLLNATTGATANANWSGYVICVTDFQYAHGLAIVSQFYNPNGGITYGYQANVIPLGAGNLRATAEALNH